MKSVRGSRAVASLCMLLAACGGGGGADTPTPITPPGPNPTALAQQAGLAAKYWVDASDLASQMHRAELQWTDVFSDEIGYRIEVQKPDGQWAEAGRVAAIAGNGQKLSFALTSWLAARVIAELPAQQVTLRTLTQLENLAAPVEPVGGLGLPGSLINGPLAGVVALTLAQPAAASLELNGQTLTLGTATPGVSWDSRTLADGRYAYSLSRPLDADRRFVEAGRLTVANRNPSAIIQFNTSGPRAGASIDILRWDNAVADIPRLFVDGVEVAQPVLTGCLGEPRCTRFGGSYLSGMFVNIADFPSGLHQLMLRLDTKDGGRQEYSSELRFDRPPVLSLSVDPDGSPVAQELRILGRLTDDGGTAELRVLIDGELRSLAAAGDFDLRLDTTSLSEGEHRLTLLARDGAGQETRLEQLVLKLGTGQKAQLMAAQAQLIEASASTVLAHDSRLPVPGLLWLRTGDSVERLLLPIDYSFPKIANWAVADNAVIAAIDGYAPRRWYLWDSQLVRSEPGAQTGGIGGYFDRPLVDGPWLATTVGNMASIDAQVQLRQLVTGRTLDLARKPIGPLDQVSLNSGSLVALPDGSARLVWQAGDSLMFSSSVTGRSEVLELGTFAQPITDGSQVAWQRGSDTQAELMLRPASPGGSSTRVAPQAGQQLGRFMLHSGLLVWTEIGAGKSWLYMLRDGKPQLLAEGIGGLIGTAQQRVVYAETSGRLMLWTAARGARPIFSGGSGVVRGSALMVELGSFLGLGSYLYRIPLDQLD